MSLDARGWLASYVPLTTLVDLARNGDESTVEHAEDIAIDPLTTFDQSNTSTLGRGGQSSGCSEIRAEDDQASESNVSVLSWLCCLR